MNDRDTTLTDLKGLVREFRDQRDWGEFHTPKNLSMSIAIEAAELMEEFQWLTPEESLRLREDEEKLAALGEELADVLIYALSLANVLDIDITTALSDKLAKNTERYKEDDYRGRL